MIVELIYEASCPHAADARADLVRALASLGLQLEWTEWVQNEPGTPNRILRFGSPTILVNHKDVDGTDRLAGQASCCRFYGTDSGEKRGSPSRQLILAALQRATAPQVFSSTWKESLAAAPGIGIALLPKLACPACWPAYAAVLSSLGLGFLLSSTYLFRLTVAMLGVALGALAYGSRKRRRYAPLLLAAVAAAAVMIGKFVYETNWIVYAGFTSLVLASLWNAWQKGNPP